MVLGPSCQAKRSAAFAEKLVEEILAPVPHRHYIFTIPKALRGLFQRDRRLLGLLSRCAYDAVKRCLGELFGRKDLRPGAVLSLQTFGSFAANFHPHVHALISDGVFTPAGEFLPLASLDTRAIEELFRRLVLARLHAAERLSESFLERLLAWSPSGFSVHAEQVAPADDRARLERLARYITRAPMRLDALELIEEDVVRVRTPPNPRSGETECRLDLLDWVHAVVSQLPDARQHVVRYFGAYSCRGHMAPRPRPLTEPTMTAPDANEDAAPSGDPPRATPARRASWARLIQRIFEVDPLLCGCGATMKIVSVITDARVIDRILRHLRAQAATARGQARPPPT